MKWIAQIRERADEDLAVADFFTVKADGPRDAALAAIGRKFKREGKPAVAKTVSVYVAPKNSPRHATGMPFKVHGLQIAFWADESVGAK